MRASTLLSLHQKYLERIAARQKQLASKLSNNRQTKGIADRAIVRIEAKK